MRRNTVQIPVANRETLAGARFRTRIFFNVTAKFHRNLKKTTKMISI